jgi:hypothetical protein
MTEKPLHVRVAEALGWRALTDAERARGSWYGARPGDAQEMLIPVPRFDTDWSAGGPLIERFQIDLRWGGQNLMWWAGARRGVLTCSDPAPLPAVCELLLALHAAGKLPR